MSNDRPLRIVKSEEQEAEELIEEILARHGESIMLLVTSQSSMVDMLDTLTRQVAELEEEVRVLKLNGSKLGGS